MPFSCNWDTVTWERGATHDGVVYKAPIYDSTGAKVGQIKYDERAHLTEVKFDTQQQHDAFLKEASENENVPRNWGGSARSISTLDISSSKPSRGWYKVWSENLLNKPYLDPK
jgi:hypothetical protein